MSKQEHAVVIGGSIAGLLAARVLADHFSRVTVLERDALAVDGPSHRAGVPQGHHLHILLMRGQAIFEELLPGIRQELIAAGAPQVDSARDMLSRTPFGWSVRFESGMTKLAFTRDLLEWHLRQRVLRLPDVQVLDRTDILGLLPDGGVRTAAGPLPADLVVDASGRGSKLPRWLREMGYLEPAERTVDAHPGYASRLYRRPPGVDRDWRAIRIMAAPPRQPRVGVLFPVEGDRWLVSLAGAGGQHPPTDEAGFLAFARSLPTPLIYESIVGAEPLTEIVGTRTGQNRMRCYERLPRWPARVIALGDAVCAFNPVYGQGMTVAALEALALRERLAGGGDFDAREFQREVARIVALPWALATSEDARYEGTEGAVLDGKTRLMHRYMARVLALTTEDVSVARTLLQVQHMLKPPSALFAPSISGRVLKHALRIPEHARNLSSNVQEVEAVL